MPDDPFITEMDPVQKMWLFENWIEDQNDDVELAKNHAYLIGSFSNPEAVKQLIGSDNSHISTDEEFEESVKLVKEEREKFTNKEKTRKRKHKRKILME